MSYFEYFDSPVGVILIEADDNQLLKVSFVDKIFQDNPNTVTKATVEQLKEYFSGQRKTFDLPYSFNGTEFQNKVWSELTTIPYGEVRTYGDIARNIGIKGAARAVGNANNKNPLAIIVPCHRVVRFDSIGGYGSGIKIKEKLLDIEKNNTDI